MQLAGDEKFEVKFERTQNELADFFGVARPSIARALRELEIDGYLTVKGKMIRIKDKQGLSELTIY
jgi:DNA-binding FadR family transcriptional regulator